MLSRRLKKVTYPLRLPNLNSPCKRRKRLIGKCTMIRQLLKQTMILNYPYSFALEVISC